MTADLIFLTLIAIAAVVGLFLQWCDRRAYRRDIDRRIDDVRYVTRIYIRKG